MPDTRCHLPRRPLVPGCLAFVAGILLEPLLRTLPLSAHFVCLVVLVLTSIGVLARTRSPWSTMMPLAAIVLLGALRYRAFETYPPNHVSNWPAKDAIVYLRGVVVEEPLTVRRGIREATTGSELDFQEASSEVAEEKDSISSSRQASTVAAQREFTTTFVVNATSLRVAGDNNRLEAEGLVLVKFYGPLEDLKYGATVEMLGRIKSLPGPRNPGERDYRKALAIRGIYRQLAVSKPDDIRIDLKNDSAGFMVQQAARLRAKMNKALEAHIAPERLPLIVCMLLGSRRSVPEETEENMQMSGTVHFLAVSGLHVWMVTLLFWVVLRLLMIPPRWRGALMIALVLVYCVVVGANAPVVRASVMAGAFFLAILLGRRSETLNLVALSALVILAVRPTQLFEVGFQLSFAAVLCLSALGNRLQRLAERVLSLSLAFARTVLGRVGAFAGVASAAPQRRATLEKPGVLRRVQRFVARWLVSGFVRSTAVFVGMSVLTLFYFNLVTPISILANIILSPLVFVFLASGLATVVAAFTLPEIVPAGLGWLTSAVGLAIEKIAGAMASVPGGSFFLPAPSSATVMAFYITLALVLTATRVRRVIVPAVLGVFVCAVLCVYDYWPAPAPNFALRATVIDVGHGSSVLVEAGDGTTFLCDAGGTRFVDIGRQVIAPFLWHKKRGCIDYLVLSHPDSDHVSGVPSLLRRFGFNRLYVARDFNAGVWRTQCRSQAQFAELSARLARICPPAREVADQADRAESAAHRADQSGRLGEASGASGTGVPPVKNHGQDAHATSMSATLDIIWPDDRIAGVAALSENDRSLVLRISCGGRSILLPGDIEERGLRLLCKARPELRADVLIVPHHGGASSWLPEFADAVRPQLALVSRRAPMLEHQATAKIAAEYESRGARVFETPACGAITVVLGADGSTAVTTFLPCVEVRK